MAGESQNSQSGCRRDRCCERRRAAASRRRSPTRRSARPVPGSGQADRARAQRPADERRTNPCTIPRRRARSGCPRASAFQVGTDRFAASFDSFVKSSPARVDYRPRLSVRVSREPQIPIALIGDCRQPGRIPLRSVQSTVDQMLLSAGNGVRQNRSPVLLVMTCAVGSRSSTGAHGARVRRRRSTPSGSRRHGRARTDSRCLAARQAAPETRPSGADGSR